MWGSGLAPVCLAPIEARASQCTQLGATDITRLLELQAYGVQVRFARISAILRRGGQSSSARRVCLPLGFCGRTRLTNCLRCGIPEELVSKRGMRDAKSSSEVWDKSPGDEVSRRISWNAESASVPRGCAWLVYSKAWPLSLGTPFRSLSLRKRIQHSGAGDAELRQLLHSWALSRTALQMPDDHWRRLMPDRNGREDEFHGVETDDQGEP